MASVSAGLSFQCENCPKSFAKKHLYNRHRKYHDRLYTCALCKKSFGLKTDLDRHRQRHQLSRHKLQCQYPGCNFHCTSQKYYLWKHMQLQHKSLSMDSLRSYYNQSINHAPPSSVEDINLQLLEAVALSDEGKALECLAAGANPNAKDVEWRSAVWIAVKFSRASMVKLLLERGANVNNDEGTLNQAVQSENPNPEIISMLIEAGVGANASMYALDKLLCCGSWGGNREWWNSTRITIARLLLNSGAKLDSSNRQYLSRELQGLFLTESNEKITELLTTLEKAPHLKKVEKEGVSEESESAN